MKVKGKIQRWGNSAAIRLPDKVLDAAGISSTSEVDILAQDRRLIIQLHNLSIEQYLDNILNKEPGAAELIELAKNRIARAIKMTDNTTKRCYSLLDKMEH